MLAQTMGWSNPLLDGIARNRQGLINFGAGLAGGRNIQDGIAQGLAGLANGRSADQADALRQQQIQQQTEERNRTMEWLQQNQPDLAGMVASGMPIGEAWNQALARAKPGQGASYSQTPVFLRGPDGAMHAAQMSSGGGILINGEVLPGLPAGFEVVARPDNLQNVNLGGQMAGFDPNRGTYTPGPAIQGAPSANMDVTLNPEGGRVMAPAAGSEQDRALTQGRVQAERALGTLEAKNQIAVQAVDKALQQAGFWTTGAAGAAGAMIPGSPAYDLARTLDTIKANIGFEELQTMRDNSPTGGALGQVTERELAFLQSTIANIEQPQSEEQLRENLNLLRQFLTMSQEQRRQAFAQQYGGSGPQQAPGGQTSTGLSWSIEP